MNNRKLLVLNEIMKKEKEIKKYDPDGAKKQFLTSFHFPCDKKTLLKELTEDIIPKCHDPKDNEHEIAQKRFTEKAMLLLRIFENDSHVGLMETFTEKYQMLSREMTETMIKEYNCTNEAEKALAELAVNAYIRVIDNSRRLNNMLEMRETTQLINGYFSILSKQIDRANRQFISALLTLKQLKSPQIEMHIKSNTAFIAQNQQINVDTKNNEA